MTTDYYAELGIDRNTATDELAPLLDRATRTWSGRASRAPDPKQRRKAEDKVALIGEARKHLLDQARRTAYDKSLRAAEQRADTTAEKGPIADPQPPMGGERDRVAQARQHLKKGNDNAAIHELRQAVQHNDRNADAWRLLGSIHAKHGQYDDALLEYERARSLYPNDALTHTCIAVVHAALHQLSTAATWHVAAARLSPKDFSLVVTAAASLYHASRYDEALMWYETGLALRPGHQEVRDYIGSIWCIRAESAMAWHPTWQRYVVASASGATHVARCVEQAEAVGVNDSEVNERLDAYRKEAARASTRTWRWRAPMRVVMVLCLVPALFAPAPFGVVGMAALVALLALMGLRPRWRHNLYRLPADARPDVGSPS
ncbi:tetratricopeptide repeat protein [Streptomyces sp. NPDC102283]|uniref:tetratricopeptide repeat protein n=1 Tax=Streptomyces sp. NPDC102283 TaxID=3366155 RepID=UPI0038294365